MPRKIRQLKADLRRAGFVLVPKRGKGSHTFWVFAHDEGIDITLSGKDGDDARLYQEQDVREAIAQARARLEELS